MQQKRGTFIVRQFIQYCFTHCCNMGLILCMNFLSAVICLSLLFFLVIVHVFVQLTYIVQHSMLYSFNGHVDIYTVKCQYHWSVVCQKSQSTLKLSFSNFLEQKIHIFQSLVDRLIKQTWQPQCFHVFAKSEDNHCLKLSLLSQFCQDFW